MFAKDYKRKNKKEHYKEKTSDPHQLWHFTLSYAPHFTKRRAMIFTAGERDTEQFSSRVSPWFLLCLSSCPEMLWWQWPPVGSTELWPSLASCWTQHPALGCRRLLEIQEVLLGGKTALHWQREKGWGSTTRKLNRDCWKPKRQLLQRVLNMVTPAMELPPSLAFSWETPPFTTALGLMWGRPRVDKGPVGISLFTSQKKKQVSNTDDSLVSSHTQQLSHLVKNTEDS